MVCVKAAVDVWYAGLDVDERTQAQFAALLSRDEHARARSFRFAIDRRRYIATRGCLRLLLERHPDCGRADVPIVIDGFGKPRIDGSDLNFSVSHSRGLALYAFARGFALGCDLEFRGSGLLGWNSAGLFLSPREIASFRALHADEQTDALFRHWVRKEAWLKARGIGLNGPMQAITVSTSGVPRFLELPDDDPDQWFITDLALPCGYFGALAANGCTPVIRLHSWSGWQPAV